MNTILNVKRVGLVLLASAGMLLGSVQATAAEESGATGNQHNLSKRPYQAVQDLPAHESGDQWEGATLVNDENRKAKQPSQLQQRRINNLGKQPYMDTVD